jgi:mannosyltransferase OCH1-like enzyme
MEKVRRDNPEFQHFIFSEKDCRQFIELYFNRDVLHAYDSLIPKAFKADLWRYCVLYIHGGIYIDSKIKFVKGFRLITMTDKEYFVKSRRGIYNGIMVCKPNNPILKQAIDTIVENVKRRYYGNSEFEPTGPAMLKQFFTERERDQLPCHYIKNNSRSVYCSTPSNTKSSLVCYYDKAAYAEQNKRVRYNDLWNTGKVYK